MDKNHILDIIVKHRECLDILESIAHFQNLISLNEDSIKGISGSFPELKSKYLHNIDIYRKSIERLLLRHSIAVEAIYKNRLS